MYRETDDYKTAVIIYEKAIKHGVKYTANNHDAVARAHHGKGIAYVKMNDLESAICSYGKSLLITKIEFRDQPERVARILEHLASAFYESQQYSEAIEKLIEAKETLKFNEDQNTKQKSNIQQKIADCYECLGNFKEAIDNY